MVTPVMPKIDRKFHVPKMLSMLLLPGPAHNRPTFCRTKLMPMAEMRGASFGAFRSGL